MGKKVKIIIILLAGVLVICGALAVTLALNNTQTNGPEGTETESQEESEEVSEEVYIPGDLVLDDNDMPEDGSDIEETKKASNVKELRQLLLENGKFAIELTEDVRIEETLMVHGTKKLTGNKSIVMELYAEAFQSVLMVETGSTLILDGVTIDGNGIANGVTVKKDAGFTGLSGEVLYGVPYGVLVAGNAKIAEITIDHSMDIGVCAEDGSKISIEGAKITNSAQTGVHIQEKAQVAIAENTLVSGAFYLVRNRGICAMTGGTLRDAYGCLVYSNGDFSVVYEGKDANDRLEWSNADGEAGIRIGNGGTAVISGVYLHDMKGIGISVVNHAGTEVKNCVIANTGSYGFSTYGGNKEAIVTDVEILDTNASAIRAHSTVQLTLTNVTVKNTQGFGIKNENNLVVAKNITIENSKESSIWGNAGSETQVDGAAVTKAGEFGVENNSAKMVLKNITITDPARMGYVGKAQSVTEITNMTITNAPERGMYNLGGTVTATNVTVNASGEYAVSTAKSGEYAGSMVFTNLTVAGVTLKDAVNCYESDLQITGGNLSGANRYGAIASAGGKLTLTDVEITDCKERGVIGSGGDITLKNIVVRNTGKFGVTTGKTDKYVGQLAAENLTISGIDGNALNNNGSVLTAANVKISDVKGNGAYVENGGTLTLNGAEIRDCIKRGIYVNDVTTQANLTDIKIINTTESAIFQGPGTVVSAANTVIDTSKSYGVYANSATFTGKNVEVKNTTENAFNIESSKENGKSVVTINGLTISKVAKRAFGSRGSNVTLTDVVIKDIEQIGISTAQKDGLLGQLTVTNLTMSNVKGNALNNNGSVLSVTKGTISGIGGNGSYVENAGQLSLSNVELTDCAKRGIYLNGADSQAALTDVAISETTESSIFAEPKTAVVATRVSVDASKSYGIFLNAATFNGKALTITNSVENSINIESSSENGKSVVKIDGLTIENPQKRAVANRGGDVEITDVTVKNGKTLGITTAKADDYAGELIVDGLTLSDIEQNALNNNGSVLKVSDATLSNIKGNGAYAENGGTLSLTDVKITDCAKRAVYLNNAGTSAALKNVEVEKTTESAIFMEAGTILEVDHVSVDNSASFGVFINAATLMGSALEITNTVESAMNIESSDELGKSVVNVNGLTIENTQNRGVANRGGEVTLANVNITNVGTYGATTSAVESHIGSMSITNLNITGVKANGALNCNGSVLTVTNDTIGTLTDIEQNGIYVENGGKANLTNVEISDCGKRGVFVNGTDVNAVLNNVKVSDTVMTNVRVAGGAKLEATNLMVHMNDTIGTQVGEENFFGICIVGSSQVVIDGADSTVTRDKLGADEVPENSAIRLESGTLTIKNGDYSGLKAENGSVIYTKGTLTIEGGIFGKEGKGNTASSRGGAIYCAGGVTTITGGEFAYNSAAGKIGGGVISGTGNGTIQISGGYFHHNAATYLPESASDSVYGGGVIESNGVVTISGGVYEANTAYRGGVVYMDTAGTLNISGGVFGGSTAEKGNVTTHRGGVIYIADRTEAATAVNAAIANASFENNKVINTAAVSGGAIYVGKNSKVEAADCIFKNNKAVDEGTSQTYILGGAIYIDGSEIQISGTTFDGNSAKIGGAILAANAAKITLGSGCVFTNNEGLSNSKDIRCNNTAALYIEGDVKVEAALNNTAKIYVSNTLTADSMISINVINKIGSSGRVVVEFTGSADMDASKAYFSYFSTNSSNASKSLTFANKKGTVK